MERRPTICPICGSKITRVTNAVTKNSYFKCSNQECFFVLGDEYTDAEYDLQGTRLNSRCIRCKENLTVVNGPHGLYARCYGCDCDMRPTTYDNRIHQKYVNAHRESVKGEIIELINSYNTRSTEDVNYDFEAYIATTPAENKKVTSEDTNVSKMLDFLKKDTSKGFNAEEISAGADVRINSVRTSTLSLRTLGLIKIVGYTENASGNHTIYYQVVESPLPELELYSREDGYNTVNSFLKENKDKYGDIVRASETLRKALKENEIEPSLFNTKKGVCNGYKISIMEKLMNNSKKSKKKWNAKSSEENRKRAPKIIADEITSNIISLLNNDLKKTWTSTEIGEKLSINRSTARKHFEALLASKRVKVVDMKSAGDKASLVPAYQLATSPLEKIKIVKDLHLYSTPHSYYNKRFRGKRVISTVTMYDYLKKLSPVNLMIGKRFFVGYAVSDLKKITDEIKSNNFKSIKKSTQVKKTKKAKNIEPMEIQAAIVASAQTPVSNPIAKKKSMFGIFSSLFKKKEEVLK